MFGKNNFVSPTAYKRQAENTLTITSIFYTLQGEGPFRGEPAIFVRLTGCNRKCSFCDTYFDSGDEVSFNQILDKMKANVFEVLQSYSPSEPVGDITEYLNNLLVVLTGGEPMLQPNLVPFIDFLHTNNFRTQIESNGDFLRPISDVTVLVVSPKANEQTGKYGDLRQDVFDRANALKFVVSADSTSPYYDVPQYAKEFRINRGMPVYLSPMNMYERLPEKVGNNATLEMRSQVDEKISFWTEGLLDRTKNQANHEYAALLSMKYNMTLNLQTHLYASLP